MKTNRIAFWILAAGITSAAAHGQPNSYGPPGSPGPQDPYGQQGQGYEPGQYDDDWRESDNWYDDQSNDGYDGYDGSTGYDQNAPNGQYGYDGGYGHHGQAAVEVGFFYGALSPYGEWVRHPYYGWVWFPRNVHAGWRPYSVGRWVMSDYGWTWVSYERFGWATYHYGRWAWDRYVGWLWVPGTDWGPAWVAWQQGNGYIGWAPLPPAVGFDLRLGIQLGGFNLSFGIAPRNYAFVDERRFLDNRVGGYIVPEARNVTIIHNTTNITNYTVVDNRVINRGVPVERVERATGRRAQRLHVAAATGPANTTVEKDVVRIYRPPESKLETVRVGKRNNAGLRKVATPDKQPKAQAPGQAPPTRPKAQEPKPRQGSDVPIAVAPRVPPAPAKVNERQFTREQEELRAKQQKQQQSLEKMQRQEKSQQAVPPAKGAPKAEPKANGENRPPGAAKADPQEVQKRHAAELEEQRLLREGTAEQLKNRQQIQRKAAQETAAEQAKAKGEAQAEAPKQKQSAKAKQEAEAAEQEKAKKQKNQKQAPKHQNEDQKPPRSF